MTVLSRGARSRRGGRRPGWLLLTALLVLAIAASSALVFTNRVELLKLAVILALWAAVVAAFVSVIYRRQSDADAAKARDLKLVYDLQLDREISARREYELTVESQLRRELASELQSQAADEVAALRAELAALRNNLEILFETELAQRPAIETERTAVRAYSDWARETEVTDPGRGSASRVRHEVDFDTGENRIIDVPEEPLGRRHPEEEPLGRRHPEEEPLGRRHLDEEPLGWRHAMDHGQTVGAGAHRLPSENGSWPPPEPEPEPVEPQPVFQPPPPPEPEPEPVEPQPVFQPPPPPQLEPEPVVEPQPVFQPPPPPPQPEPAPAAEPVGRYGAPPERVMSAASEWNPAPAEGQWLPPGAPGSNWASSGNGVSAPAPVAAEPPGGRHAGPAEGAAPFPQPPPPPPSTEEPAPRHRVPAETPAGNSQHGEGHGQSVAELLARLQATPTAGGRRRRREN